MRPRTASASDCSILPFSTARASCFSIFAHALVERLLIDLAHHDVPARLRADLRDPVAHQATAQDADLADRHLYSLPLSSDWRPGAYGARPSTGPGAVAQRNHLRCRGFQTQNAPRENTESGALAHRPLRGGARLRSVAATAAHASARCDRACQAAKREAEARAAARSKRSAEAAERGRDRHGRHERHRPVGDAQHARHARRPRHDLPEQLRLLPALLPLPRDLPHRPVRPQPQRAHRPALRGPRQQQHARRLAASREIPDRHGRAST